MTRNGFEEMCEELDIDITALTDDEYELIDYIYHWNPLINKYKTKGVILAKLYGLLGINIIKTLKKDAEQYEHLYNRKIALMNELNTINRAITELKGEK